MDREEKNFPMVDDKLKLKVGTEIVIKTTVANKEFRILGNILGWEKGDFFVMKITDRTNISHFTQNRSVIVGYVLDGIVYGFNTKIFMNIIIRGLNFLVLEYPETLEVFPLRKEERMGVSISGIFKYEGKEPDRTFDFKLHDINCSGCAVTTSKELVNGDCILLSFEIPTLGDISDLKGNVVNMRRIDGNEYGYGIKFVEDDPQRKLLEGFEDFVEQIKKVIKIDSLV